MALFGLAAIIGLIVFAAWYAVSSGVLGSSSENTPTPTRIPVAQSTATMVDNEQLPIEPIDTAPPTDVPELTATDAPIPTDAPESNPPTIGAIDTEAPQITQISPSP